MRKVNKVERILGNFPAVSPRGASLDRDSVLVDLWNSIPLNQLEVMVSSELNYIYKKLQEYLTLMDRITIEDFMDKGFVKINKMEKSDLME